MSMKSCFIFDFPVQKDTGLNVQEQYGNNFNMQADKKAILGQQGHPRQSTVILCVKQTTK